MERLTERYTETGKPDGESDVWVHNHDYIATAERLADYEDTGLTPEQIMELKERDAAKAAIITGYNQAVGCKVGECPKCGAMSSEYMNFCDECGQRLKWEED